MKKSLIIFFAIYAVVAQGFILLAASLSRDSSLEKVGMFISGSIVLFVALITMKLLKRVIGKYRPEMNKELFVPYDSYAFPSGHATGISAIAFFIFEHSVFFGLMSVILGILVLGARIQSHVHDYIDIVGGIILGVLVAYFLSPFVESSVNSYLLTHMF